MKCDYKKEELGKECDRYKIDILAIQETKIKIDEPKTIKLNTGHNLLLFEQNEACYRGLGFVISKNFTENVKNHKCISDRVAYIDVELKHEAKNKTKLRIVNVYGPTEEKAEKQPELRENFYRELEKAIEVQQNMELWILGDLNARLGKGQNKEEDNIDEIKGKHGFGQPNENGKSLEQFLQINALFATNTAFKHKTQHEITWTCKVRNKNIPVFKCSLCGQHHLSKINLKEHLEAVHNKRKGNSNAHIKTIHEKIQRYKCKHCDYISTNKFRLKMHIKNTTQMKNSNAISVK